MCIIFSTNKEFPPDYYLEKAQERHSDGIGVAWVEKPDSQKVRFERALELKDLKKLLKSGKLPVNNTIIHFTKASSGGTAPLLSHPFLIETLSPVGKLSGEADGVLFQNGTWVGWAHHLKELIYRGGGSKKIWLKKDGPWNDARTMAAIVAEYGDWVLGELLSTTTELSRVVTISPDENGKLVKLFWGNWHDGPEKKWRQSNVDLFVPKAEAVETIGAAFSPATSAGPSPTTNFPSGSVTTPSGLVRPSTSSDDLYYCEIVDKWVNPAEWFANRAAGKAIGATAPAPAPVEVAYTEQELVELMCDLSGMVGKLREEKNAAVAV